ncbi:Prospero homeobox protein 1 [Liparis tanakae]|uniref:Prospero homeobox protein 1 n=1 Tax=Liparis tanakae TaxID=230148 RepID=A0A4Z2IDZ8_9TELE|nr:Prospero homeobox protein 1 [Liparis tanakae]
MHEGLTPSHLKKAKLMFFYTRYPSSNVLKTFFPDVKRYRRGGTGSTGESNLRMEAADFRLPFRQPLLAAVGYDHQ